MNQDKILYLSRKDVEEVGLSMPEIIEALDSMFKEKGEGRVEMPPKPGIHTRQDAFIHAMPAYIPKLQSAGMKWVSGYPDNQKMDLPYISGLLINGGYTQENMFGLKTNYSELVYGVVDLLMKDMRLLILLVPHVFVPRGNVESDPDACLKVYEELNKKYPGRIFLTRGKYNQNEIK